MFQLAQAKSIAPAGNMGSQTQAEPSNAFGKAYPGSVKAETMAWNCALVWFHSEGHISIETSRTRADAPFRSCCRESCVSPLFLVLTNYLPDGGLIVFCFHFESAEMTSVPLFKCFKESH